MNEKITLSRFVSELSAATGCSETTAERFLKILIEDFSDTISQGGAVRIDGIGELKADMARHDIEWTMDEDLAATVNEPFSAFEPVVLEDGITDEILESGHVVPQQSEKKDDEVQAPSPNDAIEESEDEDNTDRSVLADNNECVSISEIIERKEEPEPEEIVSEQNESDEARASIQEESVFDGTDVKPQAIIHPEVMESDVIPEYKKYKKNNPLIPWIFLLAGLIAGLTIGYIAGFCCHSSNDSNIAESVIGDTVVVEEINTLPDVRPIDSISAEAISDSIVYDSVPVDEVKAVKPVITDTVTSSRYLTSLSRKYFGDFRFWIYIYEENKGKIDDPDRIKPGTVVVIPEKDKYGINSSDPESVRKAVLLTQEYYNQRKK